MKVTHLTMCGHRSVSSIHRQVSSARVVGLRQYLATWRVLSRLPTIYLSFTMERRSRGVGDRWQLGACSIALLRAPTFASTALDILMRSIRMLSHVAQSRL